MVNDIGEKFAKATNRLTINGDDQIAASRYPDRSRLAAASDPGLFGRTAGGSIYNAYLFSYLAIAPFAGYLTDRLGARRVITFCIMILGVAVISG